MMPDAAIFLASIPGGFHVRVKFAEDDAGDVDGVLVSPTVTPSINDYGVTTCPAEMLYIAAGASVGRAYVWVQADGKKWTRRNIISRQDNITFLSLTIGAES